MTYFFTRRTWRSRLRIGVMMGLLAGSLIRPHCARSESVMMVPKWGRFEHTFTSSVHYSNSAAQARLTVRFVSPSGQTNEVEGFWDGSGNWTIRFCPDQSGRWNYITACSDSANGGLDGQRGAFLATAAAAETRFTLHGPVKVSRDGRYFSHADGTPFFWMADSTWQGAQRSDQRDWEMYARIRAAQTFSAIQWALNSDQRESLPGMFADRGGFKLNLDFFRRTDAKVDALNRAGLLSVISPHWGNASPGVEVSNADQLALALRYSAARWGSYAVAWLVPLGTKASNSELPVGIKLGRETFAGRRHAPVVCFVQSMDEIMRWRDEEWIDAWGYASSIATNGLALDMRAADAGRPRPLLDVSPPCENALSPAKDRRITADEVRRAIWSRVLEATPAGASYGAEGVVNWDTSAGRESDSAGDLALPVWQKSLFLPGARQISTLTGQFRSLDFWRLDPLPSRIGDRQRIGTSSGDFVRAVLSESKDLFLAYAPEEGTVKVALEALPLRPVVKWTNPRTGRTISAVGAVNGEDCTFRAPGPGDWLLRIERGN